MLSFRAWWSLKPFQTWGTLRAWESWLALDDIVRTWGARGPWETFRSGDALITLIPFNSLEARKTFLTLKPGNSGGSHVALGARDPWRAANARHALEAWMD